MGTTVFRFFTPHLLPERESYSLFHTPARGVPVLSTEQLTDAGATTSSNSNGVSTLEMTVNDPPTQGEVLLIANKLDELITALRR